MIPNRKSRDHSPTAVNSRLCPGYTTDILAVICGSGDYVTCTVRSGIHIPLPGHSPISYMDPTRSACKKIHVGGMGEKGGIFSPFAKNPTGYLILQESSAQPGCSRYLGLQQLLLCHQLACSCWHKSAVQRCRKSFSAWTVER